MPPLIVAAALSLLAFAPAPAAGSTTTVAPVTVNAAPLTGPGARKRSRSFVRTYAAPTAKLGQLARWRSSVCVLVSGLAPEQEATVKSRVEDVARAVGLKVERPGCRADIEIVFTGRPQDLLDWVSGRSNAILGFHYPSQTKALKSVTRPVQAWYMTATLGGASDNGALATAIVGGGGAPTGGAGLPGANTPFETVDTPGSATPNGCAGDRFTSCLSSRFENVLVVVDAGRVQGRPLGPLTDYLAMLALSQPRSLDGCLDLASIIDLFAPSACPGRAPPDGLTPADAAYLTALYAGDPDAKGTVEQSDIAGRMARMLAHAPPTP